MNENMLRWLHDSGVTVFPEESQELGYGQSCSNVAIASPIDGEEPVNERFSDDSLSLLEQDIRNFWGCALRTASTNTVFADGTIKSGIMIIGEAPGANEDAQGIPFCGASGKLLDQMLSAISINRADAYITNMVFWRPEDNRRPTKEEVESCRLFVERHIAIIKPKVLLLLGSTAANGLIDEKASVTSMRGKILKYSNSFLATSVPVVVSYHPSYLLRMPARKQDAWQDLLLLKTLLSREI